MKLFDITKINFINTLNYNPEPKVWPLRSTLSSVISLF
jgi:hypothetical protein